MKLCAHVRVLLLVDSQICVYQRKATFTAKPSYLRSWAPSPRTAQCSGMVRPWSLHPAAMSAWSPSQFLFDPPPFRIGPVHPSFKLSLLTVLIRAGHPHGPSVCLDSLGRQRVATVKRKIVSSPDISENRMVKTTSSGASQARMTWILMMAGRLLPAFCLTGRKRG